MSSATLVAPELEAEIEQLKDEIRELYPRSQAMRIEIGAKLLELQDKLAHYGNGTFIQTVVSELHIPKSTCYELMEFTRVKGEPESLSGDEIGRTRGLDDGSHDAIAVGRIANESERRGERAHVAGDGILVGVGPRPPNSGDRVE